ncbi:MAG: FAD-dependent oxidoreductase, partial [Planctomycetaceae bacterium]
MNRRVMVFLAMLFCSLPALGGEAVHQSARQIPVAYDVDVVVVGGSTGAVSAAVTAAERGARVFLAAPYPYLGEDMTATLRLWLEDQQPHGPLAEALYHDPASRDAQMPRPLHIKQTLEQVLLDAGVEFLFSCYVSDVLFDDQQAPAGIVMANRAGRQAVLARTIIDATERGIVARLAGVAFRPFPAGPHTFRRVVIGGQPVELPGGKVRQIQPSFGTQARPFPVFEYTLQLEMPDDSFRSFATADQTARSLTYHPDQQITADRLFQVPPDSMRGRISFERDDLPVEAVPLDAFRPRYIDRLYVLGGAADVSRQVAQRLMQPLQAIGLGQRIGTKAAAEAAAIPPLGIIHVRRGPEVAELVEGEVRELLVGVRPVQQLPTVAQPESQLAVWGRYDVVVVGGGTGGAPAAIAAARQGARVLVIEVQRMLGGVGTAGQITSYYHGHRVGFTATVPGNPRWSPEERAQWWRQTLLDAGSDVWFGAVGCGAIVQDDRVVGVVVATPDGRGAVLADVVIDATSNSDIAAPAGAATDYTGSGEFAVMGAGTTFRRLGGSGTNPSFTLVDDTDLADHWHVLVWSKRKYPNAFDQATLVNTRERRRIVGDFTMTVLDQIIGRTYPDTISQADSDFDTHGFTIEPYLMLATPPRAQNYLVNIPYRCLLPRGLEGLLATGLGISMHRDAIPLVRMQACIQNQGYAAGLAAAMASRDGLPLRKIDIRALQQQLVQIGNLPEEVLDHQDSLPMSREQVAAAVRDYSPLASPSAGGDRRFEEIAARFADAPPREDFWAAAVIFQHPEIAVPLLREAYASSDDQTQLAYAQMLAMLGDDTGADRLLQQLHDADRWDIGWKYASMSNFGTAYSPLDTVILALGRIGHQAAVPAILQKVALLDADADFSHHRSVALALEQLGDRSAAAALADLLAKPGMTGYVHDSLDAVLAHAGPAQHDLHAVHTRNESIRELLLARALYRLGDQDGLGAEILSAYAKDLRGHLARHA